ncbi:MAG: non-canonical purine NTP pyrophosphatase, partial [Nanoarchaeota archaeon]
LRKVAVVEDSALVIEAIGGFPGPYTRYIYERIGNSGLVKLMQDKKNRRCWYKSAIGYCEPKKEPVCFLGEEEGRIANRERGKSGWGQDRIFIPKGKSRTYAETRKPGSINEFRKRAIEKLKDYLILANK